MAYGRCGAPGCGGDYIGRGRCTNPRCVDPHGPGRRDHPEHRRRRRSRSPRHHSRNSMSPYPLPKRLPRHGASPAAGPFRQQQVSFASSLREAAFASSLPEPADRCVACLERKPQVRLEPCGCAVVCRHCVGVIMAIASNNNEDILPQCPHCRAGFHGVKRVATPGSHL